MSSDKDFFNLHDTSQGILRELGTGLTARIFVGEKTMLSIVTLLPNAAGAVHCHPEEQWGLLLEGTAVRIQGDSEVSVEPGDFWYTPSGVMHGLRAGATGARVLDIFSPPREQYKRVGKGFATEP